MTIFQEELDTNFDTEQPVNHFKQGKSHDPVMTTCLSSSDNGKFVDEHKDSNRAFTSHIVANQYNFSHSFCKFWVKYMVSRSTL